MRSDSRSRIQEGLSSAWFRLEHALRRAPEVQEVTAIESALPGAMTPVRPPEDFRRQLAERLDLAAHTRSSGMVVQRQAMANRWLILSSAVAIALSLTGVALLMRRIVRQ